ncbi:MAG: hypothetical protein H6642_16710 [Caldilineaceae bacterium]|nr:hypothetical protein [Caldilineaceae bacterium]
MSEFSKSAKTPTSRKPDHKKLLSTLKLTTTVGAVSLTLAGWGLLSRTEALSAAAQAAQLDTAVLSSTFSGASSNAVPGLSAPAAVAISNTATPATRPQPTATSTRAAIAAATQSRPTATATVQPAPTSEATLAPPPAPQLKLDVVQWVQTQAGDRVAVVRDNRGTLWYVMGTDVPLIESGQQPQYQPQLVNGGRRTRHS